MGKKLLFIIILAILILGGFWVYQNYYLVNQVKNLTELPICDFYLEKNPEVADKIKAACDLELQVGNNEEGRLKYLSTALAWKSAADALDFDQREDLNQRAVDVYCFYEQKFDDHAYALRWNIAHLYQDLAEYELAEQYFLKAIESNNISAEPYVALYHLYDKGKVKKSVEEVDQFFQDGLELVSSNRNQLLDKYLHFLEKHNIDTKAAEVRAELKIRYPDVY